MNVPGASARQAAMTGIPSTIQCGGNVIVDALSPPFTGQSPREIVSHLLHPMGYVIVSSFRCMTET